MGEDLRVVGLMPHALKEEALSAAGELLGWLEERGLEVRVLAEDARAMGMPVEKPGATALSIAPCAPSMSRGSLPTSTGVKYFSMTTVTVSSVS